MKVLTATQTQYEALNGFKNGNDILEFSKDVNGNYIVGLEVLKCVNFKDILADLNLLRQIDYLPQEYIKL